MGNQKDQYTVRYYTDCCLHEKLNMARSDTTYMQHVLHLSQFNSTSHFLTYKCLMLSSALHFKQVHFLFHIIIYLWFFCTFLEISSFVVMKTVWAQTRCHLVWQLTVLCQCTKYLSADPGMNGLVHNCTIINLQEYFCHGPKQSDQTSDVWQDHSNMVQERLPITPWSTLSWSKPPLFGAPILRRKYSSWKRFYKGQHAGQQAIMTISQVLLP